MILCLWEFAPDIKLNLKETHVNTINQQKKSVPTDKLFSPDFLAGATEGVRFVVGRFDKPEARNLTQIVSPKSKHVLKLHVYDMPQNGFEVLAFALNFVLAMYDRGGIEPLFGNAERGARLGPSYRQTTQDLLRCLESHPGPGIRYREPKK